MPASPTPADPLLATRDWGSAARGPMPTGNSPAADEQSGSRPAKKQPTLTPADLTRDDLHGLTFGAYELGARLGGGGMGQIFTARHVRLGKEFALKFITAAALRSPAARLRFEQEVTALGQLQHPHIVSAVDAGVVDGLPYLATERVVGEDLAQRVARTGPLPVAEACTIARQAALGLAHSHACGILHRDIKPSNLMLDSQGMVKILDFGLVRIAGAEPGVTQDGALLGTLDYLAPEQARDARTAGAQSDLYSLGCTLIYLLSGRPPFDGEAYASPANKIKGHLLDTPAWLATAANELPAPLVALLRQLVAKEPSARPASASAVAAALTPFCNAEPRETGPWHPLLAARLAYLSLAAAGLLATAAYVAAPHTAAPIAVAPAAPPAASLPAAPVPSHVPEPMPQAPDSPPQAPTLARPEVSSPAPPPAMVTLQPKTTRDAPAPSFPFTPTLLPAVSHGSAANDASWNQPFSSSQ